MALIRNSFYFPAQVCESMTEAAQVARLVTDGVAAVGVGGGDDDDRLPSPGASGSGLAPTPPAPVEAQPNDMGRC